MKKREDQLYQTTGVYAIENTVNGRVYVGQTLMNFGDRRDSHFSLLRNGKHRCVEMQADFAQHGECAFRFVVLARCGREDIDRLESEFIAKYRESGAAYNKCGGGRSGYVGVPMSDHAKQLVGAKNREHNLGRKASDATKRKMSATRKGRVRGALTDEWKHSLSVSHAGERSVLAKLTEDQVREIRALRRDEKLSYSEIGRRFGVTYQCVSDICNYKRWKYIE